ncbi:MAG: hypothetical protein ACI9XK_001506 [Granulosicoccus sp.]|jgi:hypothetical protein
MTMSHSTVIVLGMHRSGTSALTGTLEKAGLQLGSVIEEASDNLKGSRESRAIMLLHDDILQRNGGSWDSPTSNPEWSPVHRAFRDTIIETHKNHSLWGFKDPRTVLMVGPWCSALPSATLVGIFRHPFAVAQSLFNRSAMPYEKALELWSHYNRHLLWHRNNLDPMPFLEFSDDGTQFTDQVKNLVHELGLSIDGLEFFDNSLKQSSYPNLEHIEHARTALQLYDKLQEAIH